MLEELRKRVCEANKQLAAQGLVKFTWGNVSGIDRATGTVIIKPSGVDYEQLTPENMVVVDLHGAVIEGNLRPSTDLMTHLELYEAFPQLGGIVHTHSPYAVAWAQAGKDIPCFGTTHADYFYGSIPCARELSAEELAGEYERSTGKAIVETFRVKQLAPMDVPGTICKNHGPFAWGKTPEQAVYHAVVLEEVARMAILTMQVSRDAVPAAQALMDKHYSRKHGPNAYYGQG